MIRYNYNKERGNKNEKTCVCSWEIAKTWERFTIRLDEIHEPYKKWHNPKLKEENAKIGIHY